MDESEYRVAYRQMNERPCVFEKAILSRCAGCTLARKVNIAVREGVGCGTDAGQADCALLKDLMKQNARFSLQLTDPTQPLPHNKDLRLQCGGLAGLYALVSHASRDPHVAGDDIRAWVVAAKGWFGELKDLPYREIVMHIADFSGRSKRRPRPIR